MTLPWALRLFTVATIVACRTALPPDPSPTRPSEPNPWASAPPPPVLLVPGLPGSSGPGEPVLPDAPTCTLLCSLSAQHCSGANALWASEGQCIDACRAADWRAGDRGVAKSNTLACRVTWAHAAAQDPTTCVNAGPFSPACIDGASIPVVEVPPRGDGSCVLGLYDATDGASWGAGRRARDIILGKRVAAAVQATGRHLRIVDVSDGIPTSESVRDCDSVVTSFYDGTMTDALTYTAWLTAVLKSGRRVLILGDYGAYQDAKSGNFMNHEVVNLALSLLGVAYDAKWTKDGRKLQVTSWDRSIYSGPPNVKAAGHYLRFRPVGEGVTPLLTITRTDLPDGLSTVAFTSPRGGMVLTRYYENKDGRELAQLRDVLQRALGWGGP